MKLPLAILFLIAPIHEICEAVEPAWDGRWECRHKQLDTHEAWKLFLDIYPDGLGSHYPNNGRCTSPEDDRDGDGEVQCDFQIGTKYQTNWKPSGNGIIVHVMPGYLNRFYKFELVNDYLEGVSLAPEYDSRRNATAGTEIVGEVRCKRRPN